MLQITGLPEGFARVYLTMVTGLVGATGVVAGIGGVWLIILAGSWYCAVAGLGLMICAGLLGQRPMLGVWLGAVILAATIVCALGNTGLSGWAQVPRLFGPATLLGLVLLVIPALRPWPGHSRGPGQRRQAMGPQT